MLKRFSYEPNIHRFWNERNLLDNDDAAKLIAGCIRQGFAYFDAASNAPLDISPLLYYYGYNNLLIGAATLKKAQKLEIANHGMRLQTHNLDPRDTEKRELSNIEIVLELPPFSRELKRDGFWFLSSNSTGLW